MLMPIDYEKRADGIAIITMNRPEKHNALTKDDLTPAHRGVLSTAHRSDGAGPDHHRRRKPLLHHRNGPSLVGGLHPDHYKDVPQGLLNEHGPVHERDRHLEADHRASSACVFHTGTLSESDSRRAKSRRYSTIELDREAPTTITGQVRSNGSKQARATRSTKCCCVLDSSRRSGGALSRACLRQIPGTSIAMKILSLSLTELEPTHYGRRKDP